MSIHSTTPHYLLREDAARYIRDTWGVRCSPKTLAKLACVGGGPAYRVAGRAPLYETELLDEWVRARIGPLVQSTSGGDTSP